MIYSNRKKFITTLALMVGLAGKAKAQNSEPTVKDAKITHTEQTVDGADSLSKKSAITITNFNQSTYFQWNSFVVATPKEAKLICAPLVVIKPVVKIKDKVSFGFTTNFKIHNYNRDDFGIGLQDMYGHAEIQLKNGEIFFNFGRFPIIEYFNKFAKFMPLNSLFTNAIYFHAGPYFSHAFAGGFQNDKFMVAVGYTQSESMIKKFGDGKAIVCAELRSDKIKVGSGLTIDKNFKINGTVELLCTPDAKSELLLEATDIGAKNLGIHGAFKYDLKRQCFLIFNGCYQFNDGVMGATVGVLLHNGVYMVVGLEKNDPLLPETKAPSPTPIVEIGIKHAIGKGR